MKWIKTSDKLPEDDRTILFIEDGNIIYGFLDTEKYSNEKMKDENEQYNHFVDSTSWNDAVGFQSCYKIKEIKYWCELPDTPK